MPPTQELLTFFEINAVTEQEEAADEASNGVTYCGESQCESGKTQYTSGKKQSEPMQHQSWNRQAILLLISLYKEHQKCFKDTSMKNEKVWNMISEKFKAEGFCYTKVQCENKFKYLKSRYIKRKDNMGDKGTGESPCSFDYYKEFDEIFGDKPNIKPIAVASSIKGCSSTTGTDNSSESDEPPVKKTRMEKQVSKLWDFQEERSEERENARNKRHNDRLAVMERAITTYETVMNKLIDKM